MTSTTKALKMMSLLNIGALPIDGVWIWPVDIRNSEETAEKVIDKLSRYTTDIEMKKRNLQEWVASAKGHEELKRATAAYQEHCREFGLVN